MPSQLTAHRSSSSGPTETGESAESSARSGTRLELAERPLSALAVDEPAPVVAPRLRSLLLAALDREGRAVGAVNALRWGRPLWTDDPTALSPVRIAVPVGAQQYRTETVSLVVEAGPNYAHPLRARPVRRSQVPTDETPLSLDDLPSGITRVLASLVESGRTRLPATSRAFRVLANGRDVSPDTSPTLGYLTAGADCYRVERPSFEPAATPLSYLVASAYGTPHPPTATLVLPSVSGGTARLFGQAARAPTGDVTVGSVAREVRELAAHEHVLTPGGLYDVTVTD